MAHPIASSKRTTDSVFLDGVPTLPEVKDIPEGKQLPAGLTPVEWHEIPTVKQESQPVAEPISKPVVEQIVDPLCPVCQWRLIDPATMGYCPKCGYCRYIQVHRHSDANINLHRNRASLLGLRAVVDAIASLPGWLSVLLGGSFAILLYAKAIDHLLPEGTSNRPMVGFGMLAAGIVALGFSHFWALAKVAPSYSDVGPLDLLSPGLVWGSALRRLPETRWPLWLAGWSISLIGGAWFFITG